jgi:predicted TIM-barrel fold metal-dependent hydrolase
VLFRSQDRLLFATDLAGPTATEDMALVPYLHEAVATGKLSPAAFAKIAHENAERLLGL